MLMSSLWDIATSDQGGRGLASFIGAMNTISSAQKSIHTCNFNMEK